jgi:expansin
MANKNKSTPGITPAPALVLALLTLLCWMPVYGQTTTSDTVWLPVVLTVDRSPSPSPNPSPNPNPSPSPSPDPSPSPNTVHQGIATYYDATGAGACSFGATPGDLMVAAMNADEYAGAAVCGAYIRVAGPKGAVTVRIVDLCPECKAGHVDLSREAFGQIADLEQGWVTTTWQVTSPALAGPISYHFKDGSNEWWTAVQVRNHRNSVVKLEYLGPGGQWVSVGRTEYNYFVRANPGMGPGPYAFRVTDSYGHVLIDNGIPHVEDGTVSGAAQFPPAP